MPHLLSSLPRPAIIAHRGASHDAPENTLGAFKLAVEQGVDGIELDVRLSADGQLVVIHDATVSHTTNGNGWVAKLPLKEIKKLDAGDGEKIPTLDEVFETLGTRLLINVELKPILHHTQLLSEKVAQTIQNHQMQDVVICSSFNLQALKALAQFNPTVPRGLLLPTGFIPFRLATFASRNLSYQTLHPDYHDVLNGRFRPGDRPSALPIFTYTVNDATIMRQLFQMGIGGIFTDNPLLARQIRGF